MSTRKIIMAMVAGLLGVLGLGLTAAAGWLLLVPGTQLIRDGRIVGPTIEMSTDTYAFASDQIVFDHLPVGFPSGWVTELELRANSKNGSGIFLGIGAAADIDDYLAEVAHEEVTRLSGSDFTVRTVDGSATPGAPAEESLWVVSVHGDGRQRLEWDVEPGEWKLVVMTTDATPGVSVDLTVSMVVGWLIPLAVALGVGGLAVLALSLWSGVSALRRRPMDHEGSNQPVAEVMS